MRDGALPAVLLCLALGLLLAYAAPRARLGATVVLAASAVAVGGLAIPVEWQTSVQLGCWLATALAVMGVYFGRAVSVVAALASAVAAGLLTGAVTSEVGRVGVLYAAVPCVLVAWPGAWLLHRRWSIVLQVLVSWLLAIAILSAGLTLVSGDANAGADHLD